tara:strand:+ start:2699 stop:3463 length:765 start_codon:yes stop_codon:yes gene_type:complete
MDRNKAAYKLNDFGPLYIINLDDQPERWDWMKEQLEYWNIENYERMSAFDGRSSDLSEILSGRYPNAVSAPEIGCVTSHLRSIKHWYDTTDTEYGIFMEDDCDLCSVSHWPFSWREVMNRIPYDWDCFQIAVINPRKLVANIHPRYVDDYSTAAFVINRRYAEKLMHFHCRGDKFKLDNGVRPRAVADDLLYNAGKTYAMPLLLYKIELGSSIHEDHVDSFHKNSRIGLDHFWTNQATDLPIDHFFQYDTHELG